MKKTLLLLLVIFTVNLQAQKFSLRMNLVKGTTYYQNTSGEMVIKQHIQDQDIAINMIITGKMSYKVTKIDDGVYDMEVRYLNMAFSMDMPGGKMEFSAEKDDTFSLMLKALIDKPFGMKLTAQGRVTELTGLNALFDKMMDGFDVDEMQKAQLKAQLEQSYGEGAIRKNFETTFSFFPENPVGIGEKWTVKTQLDGGLTADIKTTYELKSVSGDYYILSGNANITPSKSDDSGKVLQDVSGTMTSDIKLNKATGWVSSAKINQIVDGKFEVNDEKATMKMVNEIILTD